MNVNRNLYLKKLNKLDIDCTVYMEQRIQVRRIRKVNNKIQGKQKTENSLSAAKHFWFKHIRHVKLLSEVYSFFESDSHGNFLQSAVYLSFKGDSNLNNINVESE